jgi:hypothetical protein
MFTTDSIPEKYKSDKRKEKFVVQKIEGVHGKINKAAKNVTEYAGKMGQMFIVLKAVTKKEGDAWEEYVEKKFPYLNIRTIQRRMKLARHVDLQKYRNLGFAGQTRLLNLINFAEKKKKEVHSILKLEDIALEFNRKDPTEVKNFRDEIDLLIQQSKPKGKKSQGITGIIRALSKTSMNWCAKLESVGNNGLARKSVNKTELEEGIKKLEDLLKQLKRLKKLLGGKKVKKKKTT